MADFLQANASKTRGFQIYGPPCLGEASQRLQWVIKSICLLSITCDLNKYHASFGVVQLFFKWIQTLLWWTKYKLILKQHSPQRCVLLLRIFSNQGILKTSSFPGGASGKESACQCRRCKRRRSDPWVGKIPWRRAWQSTPVFLPGESHGQRSLASYSPQGRSRTWLKGLGSILKTGPSSQGQSWLWH